METIREVHKVTARKDHKCMWCGGVISKGQTYERCVFKIDDVYTWKNHVHCKEVASRLKMFDNWSNDEGGLDDEGFRYCIEDEYSKDFGVSYKVPFMDKLNYLMKKLNIHNENTNI